MRWSEKTSSGIISVSGVNCLEPRSGEILRPVVLLEVVVHGRMLDCYGFHRLEREILYMVGYILRAVMTLNLCEIVIQQIICTLCELSDFSQFKLQIRIGKF